MKNHEQQQQQLQQNDSKQLYFISLNLFFIAVFHSNVAAQIDMKLVLRS